MASQLSGAIREDKFKLDFLSGPENEQKQKPSGRVLILHAADMSLIPSIPYSPQNTAKGKQKWNSKILHWDTKPILNTRP